jgi:hypothetical protein
MPDSPNAAGPRTPQFDLWTLIIVLITVGTGLLLYFAPPVGVAVLGAVTVLGILVAVVSRT